MTPIDFPQANCTLAKHQEQYLQLPVHRDDGAPDGIITSCWQLTWWERLKILWFGRLWIQQMTFGQALQPQKPSVENPLGEKR